MQRSSFLPVTIAILAAAAVSLAFTAGRQAPPAPIIATVDVEKVINSLEEFSALRRAQVVRLDEMKKELERLKARAKAEKDALDMLPEGPDKQARRLEFFRLSHQLRVEEQIAQEILDEQIADSLRGIYHKMQLACADLARANGYTLVLTSDEFLTLPERNTEQISDVMARKRSLYLDPRHDITADLIVFMNNQFNAPAANNNNRR